MNRPSRHSKTPADLSQSVHGRLNAYALGASAAGVGLLALAQLVEAKIVYTPANVMIDAQTSPFLLDLNHDGITDFSIFVASTHNSGNFVSALRISMRFSNWARGHNNYASALRPGVRVGPKGIFSGGDVQMGNITGTVGGDVDYRGPWENGGKGVKNRYLGLRFVIRRKAHFGWARLSVAKGFGLTATITGYAYETIPDKPIIAGETKGAADEPGKEDHPGPGASVTSPSPDTPQPASLGMLALGAQGVPLWRRKEWAAGGTSENN